MDKVASIIKAMDAIADEVEEQDPKIALALDMISDRLEKKAYFNPATWLPGRSPRDIPVFDYPQKKQERQAICNCSNCNMAVHAPRGSIVSCPRCGYMIRA
jgi:ribosomal protein S27AE